MEGYPLKSGRTNCTWCLPKLLWQVEQTREEVWQLCAHRLDQVFCNATSCYQYANDQLLHLRIDVNAPAPQALMNPERSWNVQVWGHKNDDQRNLELDLLLIKWIFILLVLPLYHIWLCQFRPEACKASQQQKGENGGCLHCTSVHTTNQECRKLHLHWESGMLDVPAIAHNVLKMSCAFFQYFMGSAYSWLQNDDTNCNHTIPCEIAQKIVDKIFLNQRFCAYICIPMFPEGNPASAPIQEILYWQTR